MDIRFINKNNEIINASRLSIKVIGDCLIGYNEENDAITIQRYDNNEEAETRWREIIERLLQLNNYGNDIMIDLRKPIIG